MSAHRSEDKPLPYTELLCRCIQLTGDLAAEKAHADRWQELAGRYDDIRYWLRICEDTPEGHAEFYKECCLLIFGEYGDDADDEEIE